LIELGRIPLAFRPFGTTALYENIATGFRRRFDAIVVTVPAGFDCPPHHLCKFRDLGITVIQVDEKVEVGTVVSQAAHTVLQMLGPATDLLVCYGDVLPDDLDLSDSPRDFISVQEPKFYHNWGVVAENNGQISLRRDVNIGAFETVFSGLFRFSRPDHLLRMLRDTSENWLIALEAYQAEQPMTLLTVDGLIDLSGHLAYNLGRRGAMPSRSFNRLQWEKSFILKRSADIEKMRSEYHWFSNLPRKLHIHVPVTADFVENSTQEAGYSVQYLPMQTIANLLIFGALPSYAWDRILDACDEVLNDMRNAFVESPAAIDDAALYSGLLADKTRSRVARACKALGLTGDEPVTYDGTPMVCVNQMTELVLSRIPATRIEHLSIMHGDFCGSNLLFDAATGGLKMIDPRGFYIPGKPSIYGDIRYDIAKLAHSIIGMYDSIIAGHADTELRLSDGCLTLNLRVWHGNDIEKLQQRFLNHSFGGFRIHDQGILDIMISLFLTMIPLHADNPARQRAFLANAYRIARDRGIGFVAGDEAAQELARTGPCR